MFPPFNQKLLLKLGRQTILYQHAQLVGVFLLDCL